MNKGREDRHDWDVVVARFWSRVDRSAGATECWPYLGQRDRDGYGIVTLINYKMRAPRFAWIVTNGPLPKGRIVLHRCDTPACINLDHLTLGTMKANSQDMARKGRAGRGGAKLTER